MKFIPDYIENYAQTHSNIFDSPILNELERRTHLEVMRPHMLSGYLQGQFLAFLSYTKRPLRILEIGTFTGYSAICLAQGLQEEGILHTIDNNPELELLTTEFIQKAKLHHCIRQHQGDAKDILPTLNEKWDMVFLDADKSSYCDYYDMIFPNLNIGGLIIADNVLWYGAVAQGGTEKRAQALAAFNEKVNSDPKVRNILLPLRDGLMIVEKILP